MLDEHAVRHGWHGYRAYGSASVLKAMLLVAYLNRASVRGRDLTARERAARADDPLVGERAGYLVSVMGAGPLNRLAVRAHMGHFRLVTPLWGLSEITALGQALLPPDRPADPGEAPRLRDEPPEHDHRGAALGHPAGEAARLADLLQGRWGAGTGLRTRKSRSCAAARSAASRSRS